MAAHRQPAYAGRRRTAPLPVTEQLTDNTLILPLFHQMTESEQARVIDALRTPASGGPRPVSSLSGHAAAGMPA